jgi:hypothetical protein
LHSVQPDLAPIEAAVSWVKAADGKYCPSSQYSLSRCPPRIEARRSSVPFQDPRKCADLLPLKRSRRLERVGRHSVNGDLVQDGSSASVRLD